MKIICTCQDLSIEGYYAGFDDGRTMRCAETAKSTGGLLIGVDWITHIAHVRNMIGTSCSADTADSWQFHTEGAVGTGVEFGCCIQRHKSAILLCTQSVSYTHLDVYKRQIIHRSVQN